MPDNTGEEFREVGRGRGLGVARGGGHWLRAGVGRGGGQLLRALGLGLGEGLGLDGSGCGGVGSVQGSSFRSPSKDFGAGTSLARVIPASALLLVTWDQYRSSYRVGLNTHA